MTVKTDELVALNKIYKIEFKCCLYYTTLSYYLQYDLRIMLALWKGENASIWQSGSRVKTHFFPEDGSRFSGTNTSSWFG